MTDRERERERGREGGREGGRGGEVAGEWTRKAIQMLSPNTTTSQPQEVGRERGEWGRGRVRSTFCVSSSESKVMYQQSFSANSHVE